MMCVGAKVLTASADVISTFPRNKSVWDSFYAWLVAKHGAVEGGPRQLCNRTYAGRELMDRLNLAHGQYLRRLNPGATKDGLKKAVAMANMNAGPQGIFEGHELTGEGLFFLAPDT